MSKLWGGRFSKKTDPVVEQFTESISFDNRLYDVDIRLSIAHAKMLNHVGLITEVDLTVITTTLEKIKKEIEAGEFNFSPVHEDIHMAIEIRLIELTGDTGKKLHTARSRNDQVATSTRLYLYDSLENIRTALKNLRKRLILIAEDHIDTIMPGYTHLVKAQPTTLAHHLLAYYAMFSRNQAKLWDFEKRLMENLPLGSGALASTTLPIDPAYTASLLSFSNPSCNSMDSVADRDFIIEFTSVAATIMMHLSRLSEELILWNTDEFKFIEIDDAFATGSSMMPQKKNPDIPELIRGKTARVYGNMVQILTLMKGLPLTYNRDFQEDKEPLFDTIDTLESSLNAIATFLENVHFNRDRMYESAKKGFINATDAMEYLIKKGIPNRDAHHVIGEIIAHCLKNHKTLETLTYDEWKQFSHLFEKDIHEAISLGNCVKNRSTIGGPSPENVKAVIEKAKRDLQFTA